MNLKNDFPIFKEYPELVFLDNASSSQKPQILIDSLSEYYTKYNSNIGRGIYKLAEKSQTCYDNAKNIIANFLNTNSEKICFTSSATDGLNIASYLISQKIQPYSKIILSIYEHHANILIWQRLAKEKNLEIIFLKDDYLLKNPNNISKEFWNGVSLIALTHSSNVTGITLPIKEWISLAKEKNIITVIDGAQGITTERVDLNNLNPDFYVFSAHKLYGPMGLGILYISNTFIKEEPFKLGGGIIDDVTEKSYVLLEDNLKFEAGTPNVANIYAFSKVLNYLENHSFDKIIKYTHELNNILIEKLYSIEYVKLLPSNKNSNIVSFNIDNIHPHDVGSFLSNKNIAVRVGKHCAYPLHYHLNIPASIRVSFALYNNKDDIDKLINVIKNCYNFFKE
jgi:cysteine desulfurase/selenocysteine lyase